MKLLQLILSHTDSPPAVDFKGESITFKTTTAAVIDTLSHCSELVVQREESWRKRLDREKERRKHCEVLAQKYFQQLQKSRTVHSGPDLEVRMTWNGSRCHLWLSARIIQNSIDSLVQKWHPENKGLRGCSLWYPTVDRWVSDHVYEVLLNAYCTIAVLEVDRVQSFSACSHCPSTIPSVQCRCS